jgi:hypothetical protein
VEHMPAMIDLMIAQGTLSESDRPRCVHWRALKSPGPASREHIAKALDGDEMLEKAGIRALVSDAGRSSAAGKACSKGNSPSPLGSTATRPGHWP